MNRGSAATTYGGDETTAIGGSLHDTPYLAFIPRYAVCVCARAGGRVGGRGARMCMRPRSARRMSVALHGALAELWKGVSPVPAQMWLGVSPVVTQLRAPRAQAPSRRRCGRGEPSPSADVAGVSPVQVQMWQG